MSLADPRPRLLWVVAHPDPRSLTSALHRVGVDAAERAGYLVEVSDLYAMGFKAALDLDDLGPIDAAGSADGDDRWSGLAAATARALAAGTLRDDIRAEQAKLRRADTVVLQFPLWWYGTPAILKGWIDRVFSKGFAYGIRDPRHPGRTLRYGDGPLAGRRVQVITTVGSPGPAMGPRGVNGPLDEVLFPLLHGTLWYVGMDVLPPLAVHGADRVDAASFEAAAARIRTRVAELEHTPPIPYRRQNGGDYDDQLVLHDHVAPGRRGLTAHLREAADQLEARPSRGSPR